MIEQFPKQSDHASTIRQRLMERGVGQKIKPKGKNELSAGDEKSLPDLAILDTDKISPEELSPNDRLQVINAIIAKCGWNPEEVEEKEKEILKLMPEPKFKNKRDAGTKKTQAICDWERADKDYQKELKSIEEMSTNAFQTLNNETFIKKAQERACKAIIKIIAAKKIIEAAELFLGVTI
ncbi:hypothetical protein A2242_01520 [Candidatus Falkowbacteria bacterium RIFOXYA2_FULL_47_9]|nr:MAG: hypothetical protein A2242_01520 [Candidatus Falkowbacteria bacterium RIFOXYA2_FULL_47_9]